jgi:hypothetical protein
MRLWCEHNDIARTCKPQEQIQVVVYASDHRCDCCITREHLQDEENAEILDELTFSRIEEEAVDEEERQRRIDDLETCSEEVSNNRLRAERADMEEYKTNKQWASEYGWTYLGRICASSDNIRLQCYQKTIELEGNKPQSISIRSKATLLEITGKVNVNLRNALKPRLQILPQGLWSAALGLHLSERFGNTTPSRRRSPSTEGEPSAGRMPSTRRLPPQKEPKRMESSDPPIFKKPLSAASLATKTTLRMKWIAAYGPLAGGLLSSLSPEEQQSLSIPF